MENPLDKLIEDGNTLDLALLAGIVYPRARLSVDRGVYSIRFTEEGDNLNAREKILTYLLARKALSLKDLERQTNESASPSEIEKATGIAGGTLRPNLRKLADERLLAQEEKGGRYYVPNHALNRIRQILPLKQEEIS